MTRQIVRCERCGRPYSAREGSDETYILPTSDGRCSVCGGDRFSRLSTDEIGD